MTEREEETQAISAAAPAGAAPVDEPTVEEHAAESMNGIDPEPIEEEIPAGEITVPPMPGAPNVAPDGGRIVYLQPDAEGKLTLWLSPLDGGAPTALQTTVDLVPMTEGPQWSPDGASLAVVGRRENGRRAIYIVTVEDGGARLLTNHVADDHSPRWSPDGSAIAFISGRDGRDSLNAIAADGIGPSLQLSHAAAGLDDHDPVWSTDGKRIAFARRAYDGEQVGDHIWTVTLETGALNQITKRLVPRRELRWAPDRALIMHIAEDGDWDNVSVVNPDNSAGWNIASEYGDKSDPHWTHDGQRVVYIRRKDAISRCCERATSSSNNESLDPGLGVVHHVRFLPDKRVLYSYASATEAPRFYVQEAKADAERTMLPMAVAWQPGRTFIQPTHAEYDVNGRKIGGLMYRLGEQAGPTPAVILVGDHPDQPNLEEFNPMAQALASAGLAVLTPTLPGAAGYGRKLANGLKDAIDEAEASDLAGLIAELKKIEGIDKHRIAIVGEGHGGALALLLAGERLDAVQAIAVVDPITDWNVEFDNADAERRAWLVKTFGLPALTFGAYAYRTPATFAGLIEAPLLLIGTESAPAGRGEQLDLLAADLRDLNVEFEREVASGETEWGIGQRIAAFLSDALRAVVPPADPRIDQALAAEAV